MTSPEAVWLLYNHGDLRGIYAGGSSRARSSAALTAHIERKTGESVPAHAVEVLRGICPDRAAEALR